MSSEQFENEAEKISPDSQSDLPLETLIVRIESVLDEDTLDETQVSPNGGHRALVEEIGNRIHIKGKCIPNPPRQLGTFTISRHIGSGGMGAVFEGVHQKTGAKAAIKIVPSHERKYVKALSSEVAGLAKINAPNIVRVLDTGEEAGFAWVALEWLDGVDLAALSRQQEATTEESFHVSFEEMDDAPLPSKTLSNLKSTQIVRGYPLKNTIRWFRDLSLALHAMHEAGLVHRDITPRNIVVANAQVPYLIDFGLAVDSDDEGNIRGHLSGTIPYMSPEQARMGWTGLGPPSDVYSLAITFHEFLTGHRVVKRKGHAAIDEIVFTQVPLINDVNGVVPKSLNPIFRHATEKDPRKRYRSASQLAEDLDLWLEGALPSFAPLDQGEKVRGFFGVHRQKMLWGLLIVALMSVWAITRGSSNTGLSYDQKDPRGLQRESRLAAREGDRLVAFKKLTSAIDSGLRFSDLDDDDKLLVTQVARARTDFFMGILTFPVHSRAYLSTRRDYVEAAHKMLDFGLKEPNFHVQIILNHLLRRDYVAARSQLESARTESRDPLRQRKLAVLEVVTDFLVGEDERARARWQSIQSKNAYDKEEEASLSTWGQYFGYLYQLEGGKRPSKNSPTLVRLLTDLAPYTDGLESRDLTRQLQMSILLDLQKFEEFNDAYAKFDNRRRSGNQVLDDVIDVNRRSWLALHDFLQSLNEKDHNEDRAYLRYSLRLVADDDGMYDWFAGKLTFVTTDNQNWSKLRDWFLETTAKTGKRPPSTPNIVEALLRIANRTIVEAEQIKSVKPADQLESLRPVWDESVVTYHLGPTTRNYERLRARIAWAYLRGFTDETSADELQRGCLYCEDVVAKENVRRDGKLRADTAILSALAQVERALRTGIGSPERKRAQQAIDQFLLDYADQVDDPSMNLAPYCQGRKTQLASMPRLGQ